MYPCQYALLFISKLINNIFFYKIFKQLRSCNANYNDDHYYKFIFVQCTYWKFSPALQIRIIIMIIMICFRFEENNKNLNLLLFILENCFIAKNVF